MREGKKFYKIQLIWYRIRYGLVLFSIRNMLTRIGIDICPYYLELEGLDQAIPPLIKGDQKSFTTVLMDTEEIVSIYKTLGWNTAELRKSLEGGQQCIGLKNGEDTAAVMVMQLEEFSYKKKTIPLKANEAYLENMYTFQSYRGKNLAPYLRYQSYLLLQEQGKDVCYSVTEYFNKSSLKFKKKLNAEHLRFYLHINLFKKWHRSFLLKDLKKKKLLHHAIGL